MKTAPFPVDPHLTAIALAYRNPLEVFIADAVLPRVGVGKKEFKYWQYDLGEAFTVPDTKVGRRSAPNEVSFSGSEASAFCEDFGLDDPIPQDDIDQAPAGKNPVDRAVEQITNLMLLDREVRAAAVVFGTGSYDTSCKVTLTGNDQWSAFAEAASDPIEDIMAALDAPLMRPNVAVFGQATWAKLSMHPKILKAVHGNAGDSGVARRQQVAELFELAAVHVGRGLVNSAKKGQTPSLARCWGKHAAFLYLDPTADTRGGVTFGFTAEYGSRIAGSTPDANIGLRGGQRVRVGETVKELAVASRAGYLITNAVA